MIELEVNGHRQVIDPSSTGELRELLERELPSGHVIRHIDVNGGTVDEARLGDYQISGLRSVAVRIGQVVVPDHSENQPVRLRQHVGPDVVRFASRGIDGGDLFKGAARRGNAHDSDCTARCQSIVVDEVVGAPRTAVESDEAIDEDDGRAAAERRHDQIHAIVRAREPEPASVGGKERALGAF